MAESSELLAIDFPTLLIVPDWIEAHCVIRVDSGEIVPFVMYDWQLHCALNHYRVKPSARVGQFGPAFHYRRSLVIAPQKTGKGPWSAAMVTAEAVGPVLFAGWAVGGEVFRCRDHGCGCGWEYFYEPGEPMGRPWPSAFIQLLATAEDQVDNVYRPLQSMIRNGPLADVMKVGEEFVRLPNEGEIQVVTSSATARLGNPITAAFMDETQLYTASNKMMQVAQTMRRGVAGMKGRVVETTNAYDMGEVSTASMTHTSKKQDIFRFWDEPPADLDYSKPEDRRKIHEYNYRGCGHTDVDAIDAEADEIAETDPGQAERFYGNRIRAAGDNAFSVDVWRSRVRADYAPAEGAVVVAGVDGARFDDALAIVACEVATGFVWPVAVIERPGNADDDYEHDFEFADAAMVDLFDRYHVGLVFCDPQWIDPLIDRWVARWGPKRIVSWVTSRPRQMGVAVLGFQAALKSDNGLSHNGDEVLERHVRYAKRMKLSALDDQGRPLWSVKKDAPKSPRKIDAVMAAILAWEARGVAISKGFDRPKRQRAAFV